MGSWQVLILEVLTAAAGLHPEFPAELVRNGQVEGLDGWGEEVAYGSTVRSLDAERGALRTSNTDPEYRAAICWAQRCEVPAEDRPARLLLKARVAAEGFGPDTSAGVMIQIQGADDPRPIAYAHAGQVTADGDFRELRTVFEVPGEGRYLRLLAFLVGDGTAWFDDLSITPTDLPVTDPSAGAARSEGPLEKLARGAAGELPWCFETAAALERAREQERPVLVYLRCTDDREHLASAQSTLTAEGIRLQEDGFAKDVMFRAGPLSSPEVHELIRRRFVPLCLTYRLGDHVYDRGPDLPEGWGHTMRNATTEFAVRGEPAALVIAKSDEADRTAHNWFQAIPAPAAGTRLELRAAVRTTGLSPGAEACVMVQLIEGTRMIGGARLAEVRADQDWLEMGAEFDVPAGCETIRLLAYLVGGGTAEFRTLGIREADSGTEHLVNGHLALEDTSAGFAGLPLSPRELTTPALVVVGPDGEVRHRLHRIGALSDDLVDRWLRSVTVDGPAAAEETAEDAYWSGRLEDSLVRTEGGEEPDASAWRARALWRMGRLAEARAALDGTDGAPASFVRARCAMREADWVQALAHWDDYFAAAPVEETADAADARFWRAFVLHRLGRVGDAQAEWQALAGRADVLPRTGARAAACLLEAGPRLPFAVTERAWPAFDELPEESEAGRPGRFEPEPSLRALLEMQRAGGSFGSHMGLENYGWSDAAITAIVHDALGRWEHRVDDELSARIHEARARAMTWLRTWPRRASSRRAMTDSFNNAYVLSTLAAAREAEAAASVIERIAESQLADGNWTVYNEKRPASFNTALCVQALMDARAAGFAVPEDVLERGVQALADMRAESGLFPYSSATGHEWMTTEHGSIGRDPLCEQVLLLAGRGSREHVQGALERFNRYAYELRKPTKRLYDYFNSRAHGGYYFFFAHRNALVAARELRSEEARRCRTLVRDAVLSAREGDGTFMDKWMLGRAYGTAMALWILAEP